MPPLIVADALHKSFGANPAVQGVSLTVQAGEAYGLVGPDGAGKTTTMRLLVGALRADRGHAQINGFAVATHTEQARAQLGYLAQRFSLYGDLSVLENLRFFGEVRGVTGKTLAQRSAELLQFVGLKGFESRRAEQLSGGMKQKLGLACALIHRPKILLLDEPTGGVDPVTRQDFWQLLIRVLGEGTAIVVCTPYMDEAARCQRVGFMHNGRILVEGAPRELVRAFAGQVLELAVHPKARARAVVQTDPAVEAVMAFGDRFHLRVKEVEGPLQRLPGVLAAAGLQVERLRPVAPSLEDVFIALLQKAGQQST